MYRALDLTRDQSYFLFTTTQEQLNFLRFPLGKIKKNETRQIALNLKLNVADKPDSQDICFVPNGDYASVIKKYKPESFKKGEILDHVNIGIKRPAIGIDAVYLEEVIGRKIVVDLEEDSPINWDMIEVK